eukprot:1949483-Alexandrium_andersonii.AAC.1
MLPVAATSRRPSSPPSMGPTGPLPMTTAEALGPWSGADVGGNGSSPGAQHRRSSPAQGPSTPRLPRKRWSSS